jgi:hypothetical protein
MSRHPRTTGAATYPLEIRWVMDGIGFGESMRLCVNPCPLWDNNPLSSMGQYLMWDNTLYGHILLNLEY